MSAPEEPGQLLQLFDVAANYNPGPGSGSAEGLTHCWAGQRLDYSQLCLETSGTAFLQDREEPKNPAGFRRETGQLSGEKLRVLDGFGSKLDLEVLG